jgi:hypothetical protein
MVKDVSKYMIISEFDKLTKTVVFLNEEGIYTNSRHDNIVMFKNWGKNWHPLDETEGHEEVDELTVMVEYKPLKDIIEEVVDKMLRQKNLEDVLSDEEPETRREEFSKHLILCNDILRLIKTQIELLDIPLKEYLGNAGFQPPRYYDNLFKRYQDCINKQIMNARIKKSLAKYPCLPK